MTSLALPRATPRLPLIGKRTHLVLAVLACAVLTACAGPGPTRQPVEVTEPAALTPASPATRDLLKLPPPKGKIVVAVYGFRDQTG